MKKAKKKTLHCEDPMPLKKQFLEELNSISEEIRTGKQRLVPLFEVKKGMKK